MLLFLFSPSDEKFCFTTFLCSSPSFFLFDVQNTNHLLISREEMTRFSSIKFYVLFKPFSSECPSQNNFMPCTFISFFISKKIGNEINSLFFKSFSWWFYLCIHRRGRVVRWLFYFLSFSPSLTFSSTFANIFIKIYFSLAIFWHEFTKHVFIYFRFKEKYIFQSIANFSFYYIFIQYKKR